jgi:hypothetical protein
MRVTGEGVRFAIGVAATLAIAARRCPGAGPGASFGAELGAAVSAIAAGSRGGAC